MDPSEDPTETQLPAEDNTADPASAPRQTFQREDGTDVEVVTFSPGDKSNPRNWPLWRKWSIVGVIIPIDLTVSWAASGFSPASMKFQEDFGVSTEVATLGLSLYVLGLAFGPMTLAPLSEVSQYYGRSPVYILSYAIFLAFLIGTATVRDLGGFLVLRLISGLFSSVTIANFGGTIADLFEPHETGIPMSLFLWAATFGSPSGYFLFAFVAQNRPWRDIFWALLGICGGFWLLMAATLKETRHSIILLRRAANERKARGTDAIDVSEAMKQRGPRQLFKVALLRPFRFLFAEAIIVFAALYNGYLYGLSFLFNDAFSLVFGMGGHRFDVVGVGLSFLGIMVGITFGPLTNIWQERYYQKRIASIGGRNVPEARVQIAKLAAVFSASALAGIGLIRNVAGAGFPLFARQMFLHEGYQWAGTILAFLAMVMIPIPFVLSTYGRALRLRSPWAKQHMDDLTEQEDAGKKAAHGLDGVPMTTSAPPLQGLRVVELAGLAPASKVPFAGLLLADYGAAVLLIDRPLPAVQASKRTAQPSPADLLTRHKSCIALDLKSAAALSLFRSLLTKADVLLDPYRPGVLEALDLDPTQLLQANPRLIIARLSGFRRDGPYAPIAGHDINYLAVSGILSQLGRAGQPPYAPANILADFAGGGLMCALGILLALISRQQTGKGQLVQANMVDGSAYLGTFMRLGKKTSLWDHPRGENLLDGGCPWYDVYECKNGGYMAVGALEQKFFEELVQGLGLGMDWIEKRQDRSTWAKLKVLMKTKFLEKPRREWEAIFAGTDACCTPVLEQAELEDMGYEQRPAVSLSGSPGLDIPANQTWRSEVGAGAEHILYEWMGWHMGKDYRLEQGSLVKLDTAKL
ncbi:MAG: hypothetical protein Q9163_000492 [Psora crenata]